MAEFMNQKGDALEYVLITFAGAFLVIIIIMALLNVMSVSSGPGSAIAGLKCQGHLNCEDCISDTANGCIPISADGSTIESCEAANFSHCSSTGQPTNNNGNLTETCSPLQPPIGLANFSGEEKCYIDLNIIETKRESGEIEFSLLNAKGVFGLFAGRVNIFNPGIGSDYVLKTIDCGNNLLSNFAVNSARFVMEGETQIELDEALINTIIPYDELTGKIRIENTGIETNLNLNTANLNCERTCKIEGETGDTDTDTWCNGYTPIDNGDGTFVVILCGNGICSENESTTCITDCPAETPEPWMHIKNCGITLDVPSNYVLDLDINAVSATTPCITIAAQNIILDCQEHKITNNLPPAGIVTGIFSDQPLTTIKNCTINMGPVGDGISLVDADNSTIYNNNLSNQYRGLRIDSTSNATIEKNTITNNTAEGLTLSAIAPALKPSNDNVINDNNISNNGYMGISSLNAENTSITNNTINGHTLHGIQLLSTFNNNISGNTVCNNGTFDVFYKDYYCVDSPGTDGSGNRFGTVQQCPGTNVNYLPCQTEPGEITTCGITINQGGNYFLGSNIVGTNSGSACITIAAQNVTIDCQGHQMTGLAMGGIYSNQKFTTIKNCTISVMSGNGIDLIDANNSLIYNNIITNQGRGINIEATSNATIEKNTITNNYQEGLRLVDITRNPLVNNTIKDNNISNNLYAGLWLEEGLNTTITNNTINRNGFDGIYLFATKNSTINNNKACNNTIWMPNSEDYQCYLNGTGNTGSGNTFGTVEQCTDINVTYAPCPVISRCVITLSQAGTYTLDSNIFATDWMNPCITIAAPNVTIDCQGHSITGYSSNDGIYSNQKFTTIKNCTISLSSASDGISLVDANNAYIFNNVLNGQDRGISMTGVSFATIQKNTMANNYSEGIRIIPNSGWQSKIFNNSILDNNISNNFYNGIYVASLVRGTITNNTVNGNGFDGIHLLDSTTSVINNNRACNNARWNPVVNKDYWCFYMATAGNTGTGNTFGTVQQCGGDIVSYTGCS